MFADRLVRAGLLHDAFPSVPGGMLIRLRGMYIHDRIFMGTGEKEILDGKLNAAGFLTAELLKRLTLHFLDDQ